MTLWVCDYLDNNVTLWVCDYLDNNVTLWACDYIDNSVTLWACDYLGNNVTLWACDYLDNNVTLSSCYNNNNKLYLFIHLYHEYDTVKEYCNFTKMLRLKTCDDINSNRRYVYDYVSNCPTKSAFMVIIGVTSVIMQ